MKRWRPVWNAKPKALSEPAQPIWADPLKTSLERRKPLRSSIFYVDIKTNMQQTPLTPLFLTCKKRIRLKRPLPLWAKMEWLFTAQSLCSLVRIFPRTVTSQALFKGKPKCRKFWKTVYRENPCSSPAPLCFMVKRLLALPQPPSCLKITMSA